MIQILYRHFPNNAIVSFQKYRRKSNLGQFGNQCAYGQLSVYIKGNPTDIQRPNTPWPHWPQHDRPAACGYRPAVFFHFLRLIAFSFPQKKKKTQKSSKMLLFQVFISLKFRTTLSLKLCKSRSVCTVVSWLATTIHPSPVQPPDLTS